LTNGATHSAGHNGRPIAAMLERFAAGRVAIVSRLEALEPAAFEQMALHPRLNTPMRRVDLLLFIAEHDDYHMARMRELEGRGTKARRHAGTE
jgi:hypothetical protein